MTNYVKNCGTVSSLPVILNDTNITSDMVVLEATLGNPTVLASDLDITTANGSLTISGTITGSTTLEIVLGVGYSTVPTILTDLSSNTPDNVLKANPRPGVTGVLSVENGGTNAVTAADARTNLSVYSKSEVDTAITQSMATLQDEIQEKASFKTVTWDQSTTTGTEYTRVVDIDPTENMPSNSFKIVFVCANYTTGRPTGLKIGMALSTAGNVNFYKTVESENYTDLSNGIFIFLYPYVKRLVIEEKLASNSGTLIGAAAILALQI